MSGKKSGYKRVTIVVPDRITFVGAGSESVPVDEFTIVKALVTNDYAINWYFENASDITVESIVDVE